MEKIAWIEEYLEEAIRLAYDEGHEPALKLLEKLLFEEPGYGRLHFTLGKIYFNYTDDVERAEKHFRFAIKFDQEFPDTYLYLGTLLNDDERYIQAVEVYTYILRGLKQNVPSKRNYIRVLESLMS